MTEPAVSKPKTRRVVTPAWAKDSAPEAADNVVEPEAVRPTRKKKAARGAEVAPDQGGAEENGRVDRGAKGAGQSVRGEEEVADASRGAEEAGSEDRGEEEVARASRGAEAAAVRDARGAEVAGVDDDGQSDRGAEETASGEQRLVKVPRKAKEPEPELTIDEIIARANRRKAEQMSQNAASFDQTFAEETEPVHGPRPAVPPEDPRPNRRMQPTFEMDREAMLDALGADMQAPTPTTLADIVQYVDGENYFLHVTRVQPRVWGGVHCAGVQRPVRQYLTDEEFCETYGGGEYQLRLFGPPKSGRGVADPQTGRLRPTARSAIIKYTVPQQYPPNFNAAILEDEETPFEQEDDSMRFPNQPGLRRNGPATPADARMFETSLEYEERKMNRHELRERELQQQLAQMPTHMQPLLTEIKETQREAMRVMREESKGREAMLHERIREKENDLARVREESETKKPGTDLDALTKLVPLLKGDSNELKAEIQRVLTAQVQERADLTRMHKDELERVHDSQERRIKDIEERSERRIREIEDLANRRVKDAEERADRGIQLAKADVDRQLRDVERQYTARIDDERRNTERELRSKEESAVNRVEMVKSTSDMRITTVESEAKRLRSENERLRHELEEAKDLPSQIERFSSTAEALGYQQGGAEKEPTEPEDLKTTIGRVALQLAAQLPEILRSAGDAAARVRGAQPTPQQEFQAMQQNAAFTQPSAMAGAMPMRTRDGTPFVPRRLAFGTEDGPDFQGPTGAAPPPRSPIQPNYPPPGAPQPAPAPMPAAPPASAPVVAAPAPAPQPVAAPPVAPDASAAPRVQIPPEQIAQYRVVLESAFTQNVSIDEVATDLIAGIGPAVAKQMCELISPEDVIQAIGQMPDGQQSALMRREGQKYVQQLWKKIRTMTATA